MHSVLCMHPSSHHLERGETMPGFDGTGPRATGPMTGRGRGYCVIPLSTQGQELDFLKKREQALREELEQIEARIVRLEAPSVKPTVGSER